MGLISGLLGSVVPVELMYNHPDGAEFEFIELENQGDQPIDLAGAEFTDGISFRFTSGTLNPGEHVIVAKDKFTFELGYPEVSSEVVVGDYEGQLSNGGEKLVLIGGDGGLWFEMDYEDGGSWPGRADGQGSSLQLRDGATDLNDGDAWQPSQRYGGSPGSLPDAPPTVVVVNEVLTHSDPPYQDAIELKNLGQEPVDIGGWWLSDTGAELDRFLIPSGITVEAGGYVVFYEQALNFENTRVPFSLSSARGDRVVLTSVGSNGLPQFFMDDVSFNASLNGVPFGRWPDGVGPLITLEHQTFGTDISATDNPSQVARFITGAGAPNADPLISPVVISKIMYQPLDTKGEFLELTNRTPFEFPLFDTMAPTNRWQVSGAIQFDFPINTTIPANGSVIVANTTPTQFALDYPDLESDRVFGPYQGSLNNAGERIELLKPDGPLAPPDPNAGFVPIVLMEEIRYDDELPWPTGVDGTGQYLFRKALNSYGNTPENWMASGSAGAPDENLDSDADGIPDVWESQNGLDPENAADAVLDFDQDGASNRDEYQAATNPNDPQDVLRIRSLQLSGDTSSVEITFEARPGITYQLVAGETILDGERSVVETKTGGESAMVETITISVAPQETRFFRLVAERQN